MSKYVNPFNDVGFKRILVTRCHDDYGYQSKGVMSARRLLVLLLSIVFATQFSAENIKFADAAVKALCVTNWDTDKDGELSEEEAAAVTSLGSVFREQKTIVTFDELVYFTGLIAINDYAFYKSSIQQVIFPPTVTAIGEYAFSQSSIGSELKVPGTIKDIKRYAFYNCKQLNTVLLDEGVETIGYHSFSGPIRLLSLPESITFLSSYAVDPYVNSSSSGMFMPEGDLYVFTKSAVPPAINDYAFYYVFAAAHLIIPYGSESTYKDAWPWSHFGEYIEVGDVNRDGKLNVADIALLIAYITGREYTEIEARIADVNGDGAVDADDVTLLSSYILE